MEKLSEDVLISKSKFQVTSADTDMFARVRIGALINYLIQSAIHSADKLGFGYENIREQQLFWVISRLTVEIERPLKWYEHVEVETWPKNVENFLYIRDFLIKDKQQQIVGRATSGWLAVDLKTKRPKNIEGLKGRMFDHLKNINAIEQSPEKLPGVKEGDSFEVKSGYFDIDLNRHVTSTRYIDWMMNSFSLEFHENHYPKEISVNYMKETMPEETIRIIKDQLNSNDFNFEGFNVKADTTAFRGRIKL